MSEGKFWMVYVAGRSNPVKRYQTYSEASVEAERLARKEGTRAYVLESVSVSYTSEVVTDTLE